MNRRRLLTFAVSTAATGAIAPAAHAVEKHFEPVGAPSSELISLPELQKPAEAEIGRSMVVFGRQTARPAIRTSQAVSSKEIGIRLTIPAGLLYLKGTNSEGKFYESVGPIKLKSIGVDLPGERAGLFVPNNPKDPMYTYRYMAFGLGMRPVGRVPFEETVYAETHGVSFRIEFIYAGCINNILTATYREFKDDMARPAFTQELKYDISSDKMIGFKGARIEVLSAGNTSISYVVHRGFDELVG
jgi:hypothetical protein